METYRDEVDMLRKVNQKQEVEIRKLKFQLEEQNEYIRALR